MLSCDVSEMLCCCPAKEAAQPRSECFATRSFERGAVCKPFAGRRLKPAPPGSRPLNRWHNAAVMFPVGSAGVKDWLQRKWAAARSQLKAPSVAVDTVSITQGHLRAHITGEPVPRHFEQLHMSLRLGRNYKSLAVDLQGTAFPCSAWDGRLQPASDCRSVM